VWNRDSSSDDDLMVTIAEWFAVIFLSKDFFLKKRKILFARKIIPGNTDQ